MRFRRHSSPDGPTLVVAHEERWIDLSLLSRRAAASSLLRDSCRDLVELLAGGEELRDEIAALCEAADAPSFEGGDLLVPFDVRLLRCFSAWQSHWEQASRVLAKRYHPLASPAITAYEAVVRRTFPPLRPGREFFEHPTYYVGNHLNLYTEGDTIDWPSYTDDLDYELEFGALIVAPLKDASIDEAASAIGGFVVFNDLSARDTQWQEYNHGLFGPVVKTKTFANAIGAEVVSADAVLPVIDSLNARVRVNGELWSETSTRGMQFSLAEMVAHASRGEQLHPGELVLSGTLPCGSGLELDRRLRPGDVLSLEIDGIGQLTNIIGAMRA